MSISDIKYMMDLVENHSQLSKRVAALEKKLKEPQPDSAPLPVVEEVLNSKTNLGLEEIEEVMNTIRARKG